MIVIKIAGTAIVLVMFGFLALWLYMAWMDYRGDYK